MAVSASVVVAVAGLIAAMVATSIDVAAAASHTVGGSSGWTIPSSPSLYSSWSSAQNFAPGDTLVFNFPTGAHNVVEVPKASYDACSTTNQIGSTITKGPATVTVAAGTHYYICGVSGHCSAGQKLAINVAAAAATANIAPTATTAPPPTAGGPGVVPSTAGPSGISPAAAGPAASSSPALRTATGAGFVLSMAAAAAALMLL